MRNGLMDPDCRYTCSSSLIFQNVIMEGLHGLHDTAGNAPLRVRFCHIPWFPFCVERYREKNKTKQNKTKTKTK